MALGLKRVFDGWTFSGDFTDYVPPKPNTKINEISVIRGASRYQVLGHSGTSIKFTLRFYNSANLHNFLSKVDTIHQFTDETGKTYKGLLKDVGEPKKIGERGLYEIAVGMSSMETAGVGV